MASRFADDRNVGLPVNFSLTSGGAFQLIGGTKKAEDNVTMIIGFIGHFRIYVEDFVPDILWLLQKPIGAVESQKALILGRFLTSFNKYVKSVKVEKINSQYDYKERKVFGIGLQYYYILKPQEQLRTVQFLTV